jgi:hypothetical protein
VGIQNFMRVHVYQAENCHLKVSLLHEGLLVSYPELVYDPKYRWTVTNHREDRISETITYQRNKN